MSPEAEWNGKRYICIGVSFLSMSLVVAVILFDGRAGSSWRRFQYHGLGGMVQMDSEQAARANIFHVPSALGANANTTTMKYYEKRLKNRMRAGNRAPTRLPTQAPTRLPAQAPTRLPAQAKQKVDRLPAHRRRRAQAGVPEWGKVFYVIRSWHGQYQKRLDSLLKTWVSSLPRDSYVLVGDVDNEDPKIHAAVGCHNDHSRGLCCKTAYSLALAATIIKDTQFQWAWVVDDDHYVRTAQVEDALSHLSPLREVAVGMPGCGGGHCEDKRGGFCGGAGYGISRPALLKAFADLGKTPQQVTEKFMTRLAVDPGGQAWDDISVTCHLKRYGVQVGNLEGVGLHGWRLPNSDGPSKWIAGPPPPYMQAIEEKGRFKFIPPAVFHYIGNEKEMYALHEAFKRLDANGGLNASRRLSSSSKLDPFDEGPSYEELRAQYIAEINARMQMR